jgi:pilus assembly protein CpaC
MNVQGTVVSTRIINLIRVPTSQQILLKVRIAELNRTSLREMGADFLAVNPNTGLAIGTGLGSGALSGGGSLAGNAFATFANGNSIAGRTTLFGVFQQGHFELFFDALRRNQLLKILAEPNLVALNGQRANFLAGGQFFVPTAQTGAGGVAGAVSAQAVDFGVRLDFLAHILDDGLIRLTVDPEVSEPDYTVATTLVPGGSPVPGLNKRSAHTTVELRQGQTLAIAGLMTLRVDGTANRIPGLGDLPFLGNFFGNTTNGRTERELLVLVTPYLVEPMNPGQVPPAPGDEVKAPNDLEFYFLNRIEGRTGRDFRATTEYDDALHLIRCYLRLHEQRVCGPCGYCE